MLFFKKIYLLVWKNFLFRKKHFCATAWLIILPTVVSLTVRLVLDNLDGLKGLGSNNKTPLIPALYSWSDDLNSRIDPNWINSLRIHEGDVSALPVAYAPENDKTKSIMEKLNSDEYKNAFVGHFNLIPYQNEAEIERDVHSWKRSDKIRFQVAIIFPDSFPNGVYTYKIRMRMSQGSDFVTESLQVPPKVPCVENCFFREFLDGPKDLYQRIGFSAFQVLLDRIIVNLESDPISTPTVHSPKLHLKEMPSRTSLKNSVDISQIVPHVIIMSFILCVPNVIRGIIHEKASGIKELMKMMGLSNWMHWTGWMIDSLFFLVIILIIMTVFLFAQFIGKGAISYCDVTMWLFILLLYLVATITFLFFISTFFGKPTLAIIGGLCCHIVSYYGLVFILDSRDPFASTLTEKLASSLFPNMALHWALKIILDREFRKVNIGWSTFTEPFSEVDGINLLAICGMLFVDIVLYMLLTVYLENVIPSEFGLMKPWYYPFQLSTWYSRQKDTPIESDSSHKNPEDATKPGFEEEPTDLAIGVEIRNLSKRFGNKKIAVDGLSAKLYSGEITALLGHNGAGKTTTFSILTGIYRPSSGTAFINGYNIVSQVEEVRKSVGLCPQHDLLFDELTVTQHLQFFGMLKGLSSKEAKQEAERILWNLKLAEKSRSLASTLSGGQKRRLSLANSIVGGASVLILDEPTSGLDPEARREVWDLLLALRTEGRTIVLTTHFMEEADVLGDRILIMADGKLQCSGTPLFLKKCFGDGYTLTVTLTDKADKNAVLSVIQKYNSNASFKKGEAKSDSEVAITLPEDSTKTTIFPDMFSDLTKNQQKLGILTMGFTIPSMDDVFLRVGELSHPADESGTVDKEEVSNVDNFESVKGCSLSFLMFWGLMVKLCIRNFRNIRLILLQLLPPIAGAITVAVLSSLLFRIHIRSDFPPLKISLRSYDNPITICMPTTPDADDMCKMFFETTEGIGTSKIVRPELGGHPESILENYLTTEGNSEDKELRREFDFNYIIAAQMTNGGPEDMVIRVLHSGMYSHSEPLALNAAYNTILKLHAKAKGLDTKKAAKIEITNHPIKTENPAYTIKAAETQLPESWPVVIIFDVLLSLPFAMLAATYLMFPSEERVCKGKHLQIMAGVSPLLYWTTSLLLDVFMMLLVFCVMLMCFLIFEPFGLFTSGDGAGVMFVIFMVYAFSVIPLSYLRSNFSYPSEGFSGLVILHGFTALLITNLAFVFDIIGVIKVVNKSKLSMFAEPPDPKSVKEIEDILDIVRGIFDAISGLGVLLRIFFIANPTFGLTMCFIKFAAISIENNRCKFLDRMDPKDLYELCFTPNVFDAVKMMIKSCCDTCYKDISECGAVNYCYGKLSYLSWTFESSFLEVLLSDAMGDYFTSGCDKRLVGIGQELFWMFIFGVIYYILLFMLEYGLLTRIIEKIRPGKSLVAFQANYPTDEDVIAEAERVHATVFRPESKSADKNNLTADPPYVAPQQPAEMLNSGDKNDDAVKSDEQQLLNEQDEVNDKQDIVEIKIEEDSLVVQNLCKSYKKFAAVSNISFGVKHGECFGLLGVNGAGKTTTFRMLTGDEFSSEGNAFVGNISLKNDKNLFVRQFGYCPQSDPLIGFMTGREMLNFYGRLRGVPTSSLKKETIKWLDKLGLAKASNAQCQTYSGGMKRRLSAGVALIGNPPIILLDEPTSGVDPVSRREFWKIISSIKDAGQAVIFTSHSMDECEALCTRLGIMVNGQFQCFGGAPHLKKKFGEGYTLTIKLKSNIPVDNSEENTDKVMENSKAVTNLQDAIFAKYQKVFLKEVHANTMQYQLLDSSMTWDVVFKIMEEIKDEHEIIDHYSIGETTLEQVFLTFARQQYGSRAV